MPIRFPAGRAFPNEEEDNIDAVDMDDAADDNIDGATVAIFGAKKCGGRCS